MAKSQKMTYQILAYDKPELAGPGISITLIWCRQQVNLLNPKRGFDTTSNLKPSSGDEQIRLVVR
jgi:hypothetical protein